jgi:uncharacterized membrane protein YjgN (DUF898 family)
MTVESQQSAFRFTGTWREFAPIAFTNFFLTIVTLGFYRFWATARSRRYFWSRSEFIGTPLEYTGTGKELFIGFLIALVLFGLPLLFLQFGLQAMILQGYAAVAGLIAIALYVVLMFLVGVARFRAVRYRLSRTYWRGIRGGADEQGFAYGRRYVWMSIVGGIAFGLLIPWSMVNLWNERWGRMSYGSQQIFANAETGPIMGRFLLFYLVPILLLVGGGVAGYMAAQSGGGVPGQPPALVFVAIILVVYIVLPIIALAFYSAFFRNVVGGMHWAGLDFAFEARTKDWLILALGSLGLVIVTLGIGALFLPYRNWRFFITHMHAYGEIDLAALEQSSTAEATQGEGLLDAFDVGAL